MYISSVLVSSNSYSLGFTLALSVVTLLHVWWPAFFLVCPNLMATNQTLYLWMEYKIKMRLQFFRCSLVNDAKHFELMYLLPLVYIPYNMKARGGKCLFKLRQLHSMHLLLAKCAIVNISHHNKSYSFDYKYSYQYVSFSRGTHLLY